MQRAARRKLLKPEPWEALIAQRLKARRASGPQTDPTRSGCGDGGARAARPCSAHPRVAAEPQTDAASGSGRALGRASDRTFVSQQSLMIFSASALVMKRSRTLPVARRYTGTEGPVPSQTSHLVFE